MWLRQSLEAAFFTISSLKLEMRERRPKVQKWGLTAPLGERLPYKQEVGRSIPSPPIASEAALRPLRPGVAARLQPRCNPAAHEPLERRSGILLLKWEQMPVAAQQQSAAVRAPAV